MLFRSHLYARIREGDITAAFRCWKRPSVRDGSQLRTPAGVLSIDEVTHIQPDEITDRDARAAGFADRDAAVAELRCEPDRQLYRIRFHRAGDDPREELRGQNELSSEERREIAETLRAWDRRSQSGPWTSETLRLIGENPGTPAGELAGTLGAERLAFKRRVRRLKELGLTESLPAGYRLSPRGQAYLDR